MQEDLLHFIWKYRKLQLEDLSTTNDESLHVERAGTHNEFTGPDFFNARIEIDRQLWAGNVEIHLKSSDWYAHGHEKDRNYDNVILHVVWEHDAVIFRQDGSKIPTLELKDYISQTVLDSYRDLFNKKGKSFINCEKEISAIDGFLLDNWLGRLCFERLQRKSEEISALLSGSKNNWEQVLFISMAKNFGLKTNGEAFLSLAKSIDFHVVRKLKNDVFQLESVFFGMAHLLNDETIIDDYYLRLQKEYHYQKKKFSLNNLGVQKPEFFRLRPPNFPTIRLSQLAVLYSKFPNLFSEIIGASTLQELYDIFDLKATDYWTDHFSFGNPSKKSRKKLTKNFTDLLIVNTLLPLKLCHAKYQGKDINAQLVELISGIKSEQNSIVSNFGSLNIDVENAMYGQALLQLHNEYCTKNRCLQCAVGAHLLNRNG